MDPSDSELKKEMAKGAVELMKNVYEDVAQPAAKELGLGLAAVGSILRLVLRPLQLLAVREHARFDRFDENVRRRMRDVPSEKIVEPPKYIAAPLLMGYAFADEEPELCGMFEQLLATAMNVDTQSNAHPSFVEAIKQMTPDEGRMMRFFRDHGACQGLIRLRWMYSDDTGAEYRFVTGIGDALGGIGMPSEEGLENLQRLGFVRIDGEKRLVDEDVYKEIRNGREYAEAYEAVKDDTERRRKNKKKQPRKIKENPGTIELTKMGRAFIRACIVDQPDVIAMKDPGKAE